ncbi:MAG: hypothetical protein ACI316_01255 [Lactimicrobium massiliense]
METGVIGAYSITRTRMAFSIFYLTDSAGLPTIMPEASKENGYSTAGVYGYHQSSAGTASGYWSPDSVYQSGVLPASDYLK